MVYWLLSVTVFNDDYWEAKLIKKQSGWVDVHNHILPGIDDGSKSMDMTMDMLRIAAENGISTMIVTPHYKAGRHNASPEKIDTLIEQVQALSDDNGFGITLYPGNEIFYFSELDEALEDNQVCTMNGTEYVLIEFMPGDRFTYIRNALDNVMGMGYTPIIAHIERYECIVKNFKYAEELVDMGVQIQVNASSIAGEAGWNLKRFARKLIKKELVTYIGTDAHSNKGRTPSMDKCRKYLEKKADPEYAEAVLGGNAEYYLLGAAE